MLKLTKVKVSRCFYCILYLYSAISSSSNCVTIIVVIIVIVIYFDLIFLLMCSLKAYLSKKQLDESKVKPKTSNVVDCCS